MSTQKYGVVYTPDSIATFMATLLKRSADGSNNEIKVILDPACGEGSLLKAAKTLFGENCQYIGIDIDLDAVNNVKGDFTIIHNDTLMPQNAFEKTAEYWKDSLPCIDAVIANPPWSSQKLYSQIDLTNAGYTLISGQYDSYVLFIELAYNILRPGGIMVFILPDSLFDTQNEKLRKFLAEKTHIEIIARLGEKLFEDINRAATVIVCRKELPKEDAQTTCFRLSTNDRRDYLLGKSTLLSYFDKDSHLVKQHRFIENKRYNFDIDTHSNEEQLIKKITSNMIDWRKVFYFGRGVEISKSGTVVYCPKCQCAQGYKKSQFIQGWKMCSACGEKIPITEELVHRVITKDSSQGRVPIYVGENIRRYKICGENYIIPNIKGINYKDKILYYPPKLLIRKTGLGIYCTLDNTENLTSQTVYVLKNANPSDETPLEYYLALINSRVVYYYYLKIYGENEWKSHPYLTKKIIYDLPIRPYEGSDLDLEIVQLAKKSLKKYDHSVDIKLENKIMEKYGLTKEDGKLIIDEMNRLPNLGAVNDMKMEE